MIKYFMFYIIIIFILITLYALLKLHYRRLFFYLQNLLDEIFFEISIFLYKEKNIIPKFENLIEVLYLPKEKFIKWFHHEPEDFLLFWQDYQKNLEDLSKILNKLIINIEVISKLSDTLKSLLNIKKLLKFLEIILCVLSFGIFCIFKKLTND